MAAGYIWVVILLGVLCSPAASQNGNQYCNELVEAGQHGEELTAACDFALLLSERLPNFVCKELTKRFDNPTGKALLLEDTIEATVTHDHNGQQYTDIKINGRPSNIRMTQLPGTYSEGEFFGDLKAVFDPSSTVKFKFVKEISLRSTPALEYEFHVPRRKNQMWSIQLPNRIAFPGYKGKLWLAEGTGQVLRLEIQSVEIPPDFPMLSISVEANYADVILGDGTDFVLPTDLTSTVCKDSIERCSMNQTTFRDCHKFAAKSRIVPSDGN